MGSLATNSVLADAILISPRPPIPPITIKKVRDFEKSTEISRQKTINSKCKKMGCRDG